MVLNIRIKYFGQLIEKTGKIEEVIAVKSSHTLFDVQTDLLTRYPSLKNTSFQTAYNHKITSDNCILEQGSEIALMPPFSGG